ncbi:hypothetical protein BA768_08610 [Chryseobacterium sp. CBo1]|uniref:hypothetical protein n=1 Tax=Chryseobacterium sp. CBo1 TaxID=1869230 RepID=UPI000810349E|nr:hypothetical protein [Chryseobacterium sp. CBo1]OCK49641.1 hypothetical protein BA768_08610 [Chryseobacterium sp. CBo1]
MKKSINILFGNDLKDLGYKMSTVNHFEKKYKNYIYCIDRDISDFLLLRLQVRNSFGETKCIESKFIPDLSTYSINEFLNIINETENTYYALMNKIMT